MTYKKKKKTLVDISTLYLYMIKIMEVLRRILVKKSFESVS